MLMEFFMQQFQRFLRYINPHVEPNVKQDIDRQSLRSIYGISLIFLFFEALSLVLYLAKNINHLDRDHLIRMICVGYCLTLCSVSALLSKKMLLNKNLPHRHFFIFKIVFFVLFTSWAIFVDYSLHYKAGDQLMTYYIINLVMICFVIFRPWIGAVLIACAYAGLYALLYSYDRAAGIQPLNYIMFMIASIACNAVRCHGQIKASAKTVRLMENNESLETVSRRDGLTGVQNRLALEEAARMADGRHMTAYMVDINYFKEINDQHGHAAGDAILRETSEILRRLFPGGHYYRYGGDEFLVLTYKPPEANYGSDTYDFVHGDSGSRIFLSIGNAQGEPSGYQELFDLISQADKALYITKQRTHSVEFGGHDRRKAGR